VDFSTLKMEWILSSETSFHRRSTQRHIPEDGILHSSRRENHKSYNMVFVYGLFEDAINGEGVGKDVEGIGRGVI
jgi:hypothetical protein